MWCDNCYLHYYNHYNCFSTLCPGLPGWAGTRRHIHPLTTILIINYHLSSAIHGIPPVQFMCLTVFFAQPLSKSSLVYIFIWHPPLHTPYISSPNDCLPFLSAIYDKSNVTYSEISTWRNSCCSKSGWFLSFFLLFWLCRLKRWGGWELLPVWSIVWIGLWCSHPSS